MLKKSIFIAILLISIISCNKKVATSESKKDSISSSNQEVLDNHTAKKSLDYLGTYIGVLPCADCSGIETKLVLNDSINYTLFSKYLDTNDKGSTVKGTYSWNKEGNTIILAGIKDAPNKYFIGENQISVLDMQGKRIDGQLANNYILKKQNKEEVVSENEILYDTKYKLVELRGEKVKSSKRDFFIQFDKNGRFSAFAGCNNMGGEFEITNGLRIKFSKVISTMMACEDMKTEQELASILELVDNYSVSEKSLSLNKARMAPLARFEIIK